MRKHVYALLYHFQQQQQQHVNNWAHSKVGGSKYCAANFKYTDQFPDRPSSRIVKLIGLWIIQDWHYILFVGLTLDPREEELICISYPLINANILKYRYLVFNAPAALFVHKNLSLLSALPACCDYVGRKVLSLVHNIKSGTNWKLFGK